MTQPGPLPGDCSPNPTATAPCRTWSASYSMVDQSALDNYLRYTGDSHSSVRTGRPSSARWLGTRSRSARTGSSPSRSTDDADWNLEQVRGELTYVNAVYVQALDPAPTSPRRSARRVRPPGGTHCTTRRVGRQRPTVESRPRGVRPVDHTTGGVVQDANVMAVLAGIAGPGRAGPVLATLAPLAAAARTVRCRLPVPHRPATVQDVSPFMGGFNVLADFEVGDTAAALALIRQEWGFMVTHDPGGVDWERIQLDGVPAGGSNGGQLRPRLVDRTDRRPVRVRRRRGTDGAGLSPLVDRPADRRLSDGPRDRCRPLTEPSPSSGAGQPDRSSSTESTPHDTTGTVSVPLVTPSGTIARNGTVVWRGGRPAGGVTAHAVGQTVMFTATSGTATYASTAL